MTKFIALGATALALTCGAASADTTFTISWWGFNGEKLDANVVQPFKKICGCEIVFETGNNADRLNKLVARGGAGVDVIFLTDSYSQLGIEQGIFQPIDRAKIPNVAKVYDLAKDPQGGYGPAYTLGKAGIVYDSAKVQPVTSWADLWRDDLKSSVTLPGITTTAGPMVVVRAAAVAGVDPYTQTDAAFGKVAELKANVVKNYNTGSEMINLVSTGEATVAMAQDFTMKSLTDAVPTMTWATLKEGDIATLNTLNIPKGAANVDLAYKFIDFMLSTEVQQVEAEQGVDAPVNTEVKLTPEQAKTWTYGAEAIAKLNRIDYAAMNKVKKDWIDRWNEIFGG
jgi:putative spermidine/putrescine transport system substrate-binding protein